MKRAVSIRLAIALIAFCLPLTPNSASAEQEKGQESATTEQKPAVAYRIELSVREIEDGKRLNSRNYMMVAKDDEWGRMRVGDRVAIPSLTVTTPAVNQPLEYREIGMNIDCRPRDRGDSVALSIRVDFSGVAPPTGPATPVFRTERAELESIVTPGKPTLVASMDDVISNRRYEIEVTATKVK